MPRKHNSTRRRAQDRRNRDRQHSKPDLAELDRKPEPSPDPRDVASGWIK